jgi:hypothetical protein
LEIWLDWYVWPVVCSGSMRLGSGGREGRRVGEEIWFGKVDTVKLFKYLEGYHCELLLGFVASETIRLDTYEIHGTRGRSSLLTGLLLHYLRNSECLLTDEIHWKFQRLESAFIVLRNNLT